MDLPNSSIIRTITSKSIIDEKIFNNKVFSAVFSKLGIKEKYDSAELGYCLGYSVKKVKKKYEKGLKKINAITLLYSLIFQKLSELKQIDIVIENKNVVNTLIKNIRLSKKYGFYLNKLSEANIYISDKVLLWLLTKDYNTLHCIFRINKRQYYEIRKLIKCKETFN